MISKNQSSLNKSINIIRLKFADKTDGNLQKYIAVQTDKQTDSLVQKLKCQHPKSAWIEICNSFSFSQSILPFGLAESGLFAKMKHFCTKVEVQTFQMCWKSRFATVFVFSKVFCLFGQQKVVYLLKRKQFCTKLEIPTSWRCWNRDFQQF